MFLRLSKPYIAFVALVGTATLGFIGWAITAQVYGQWSRGLPISDGWNWPIVLGIDFSCLMFALVLYWKIYADAKTVIDATGVSRPSPSGVRHIAWQDVTGIKVFGGVGFHIYAGNRKIVVSPYAYEDPASVIEAIGNYSAASLSRRAA